MARLKLCQDGHYIIQGPDFPGGVMIVRQISLEGVEWLNKRGITDNDQVPLEYIIQLKECGWVWTGGTGIYGPPSGDSSYPEELLSALEKWGRRGNPHRLKDILAANGQGISLNDCFALKFLSWVIGLEEVCAPRHLYELIPQEIYENFLTQKLTQLPRLHTCLLDREKGRWVLCHWMRWTSEVWQQKKQRDTCPEQWLGGVHQVIFQLFCDLEHPTTVTTLYWKKNIPYVRLRGDEVELVVPTQKGLPKGRLNFCLNGTIEPLFPSRKEMDTWFWDERVYPLRNPNPPVYWTLYYSHDEQDCGNIMGRFPPGKILLFKENGTFVRPGTIAKASAGQGYIILFHAEACSEVISKGVNLEEERRLDQPVGWWDWEAYHIFVPEQVESLGSYKFEQTRPDLLLTLPQPPAHSVEFFPQVSVYLGKWPWIKLENVAGDTTVTVTIEGETTYNSQKFQIEEDTNLDLNLSDDIRQGFGLVTIRAQSLSKSGYDYQETQFLRLPRWNFDYTDDPEGRGSKALVIAGISAGSILPRDNCQVCREEQMAVLVTLNSPLVNPVAFLTWQNPHQKDHIPFAVCLPVNRGDVLEHGKKLPDWQNLPLTADPDFLTTTREGEIRLELMESLPQGEVWVKASGNRQVQVGQLLGRRVRIPCHRLRDYLGCRFLTLYLKTAAGWQPILQQPAPVIIPPPPDQPELTGLVEQLWQADSVGLWDIWRKAKKAIGPFESEVVPQFLFLGPHLGDWDGLREVLESSQIPEVEILSIRSHLRRSDLNPQDIEHLKAQIADLSPDSYQKHAEGEWWYRMARHHWTQAPGALNSSYSCLSQGIWGDPVSALEAYCLAAMVALINQGEPPPKPPSAPSANIYSQLFQECFLFLGTAWKVGSNKIKLPHIPESLTVILAPQDDLFLKACLALLQEEVGDAGGYLDQLSAYTDNLPVSYNLLQARLYRLKGERKLSVILYRSIIDILPFVLDEMYS